MAGALRRWFGGLHVGRVLGRSFWIWLRNFGPFTILAVILYLPLMAFALWFPSQSRSTVLIRSLCVSFLPGVLSLVVAGALAYGVFEELRGATAGFRRCVAVGLSRFGRVLGVAAVYGLTVVFLVLLASGGAGMLVFLGRDSFFDPDYFVAVAAVFGIPAYLVICRLWVAIPAAVVEGTGVFVSMRRSAQLTRGARLPIFVVFVILAALHFGAGRLAVAYATAGGVEMRVRAHQTSWLLLCTVLAGFTGVTSVVTYWELRRKKEAIDLEQIAAVFA